METQGEYIEKREEKHHWYELDTFLTTPSLRGRLEKFRISGTYSDHQLKTCSLIIAGKKKICRNTKEERALHRFVEMEIP